MREDLANYKVVLFGAGNNGINWLERLTSDGIVPAYFVDNNSAIKSVEIKNQTVMVKRPKVLHDEDRQLMRIIVTPCFPANVGIETQVKKMGLEECLYFPDSLTKVEELPLKENCILENKRRQYEYTYDDLKAWFSEYYSGLEIPASDTVTDEEVAYLRDVYGVKDDVTSTIKDYQIAFINHINKLFCFKDMRVLEIGGSNTPREIIVDKMQIKNWVCIDEPVWKSEKHKNSMKFYEMSSFSLEEAMNTNTYFVCRGLTDDITPQFFGKFDIVISNSCFEHIQNLAYALKMIHNCLVIGGILYTEFGPIWSSQYGSHFTLASPELYHSKPGIIPPFSHFLHSRKEIYELLLGELGFHQELESWAEVIKNGSCGNLNHYFYEDYEYFLDNSPFTKKVMYPSFTHEVNSQLIERLKGICPNYERFDVGGIAMLAVK